MIRCLEIAFAWGCLRFRWSPHPGHLPYHGNFYSSLRIIDVGAAPTGWRRMKHGFVEHGAQYLDPQRRQEPISYYGRTSGVALAIQRQREVTEAALGPASGSEDFKGSENRAARNCQYGTALEALAKCLRSVMERRNIRESDIASAGEPGSPCFTEGYLATNPGTAKGRDGLRGQRLSSVCAPRGRRKRAS
jgi:hypothetical protein